MSKPTNLHQDRLQQTRRQFIASGKHLLGGAALASLGLPNSACASNVGAIQPHFAPKAKRVIYLHMVGGPSQMDLFDHKPQMNDWYDKDLPESIRNGQRLTTMTSGQARFPIAPTKYKFGAAGECGLMMNTELLPNLAKKADDICWMRSLHTEAINHDPAITFINTGTQQPGRASLGSWVSYGLGSPNDNFPAYVVMISKGPGQKQALYERLWSSGFLPSKHQGVKMRGGAEPVL